MKTTGTGTEASAPDGAAERLRESLPLPDSFHVIQK
jgi:hypothetical protein